MCNTSKSVTAHLSLWANTPVLLYLLIFCVKSKLNLFWALIFPHCLIFNTQNIPVNQVYFHPYYFVTFMEDTYRYKILYDHSPPCHPLAGHKSCALCYAKNRQPKASFLGLQHPGLCPLLCRERISSPRPLSLGLQHPELGVQLLGALWVMGNSSRRRSQLLEFLALFLAPRSG